MARITAATFSRQDLNRNTIQDPVKATYCSFTNGGEHYFQIRSYGRNGRPDAAIASQTIQIDREMAVLLVGLLKEEFAI